MTPRLFLLAVLFLAACIVAGAVFEIADTMAVQVAAALGRR
jgi:hypothetical protein